MGNKLKRPKHTRSEHSRDKKIIWRDEWHIKIVAGLCAAGFLVYANSFSGSFHFDDLAVIVNNPAVRDLWDLSGLFNAFNTRVIPGWTFAVNYALGQLNVAGYHFFNIWLHVCNSVLVYALAQQLLGLEKDKRDDLSRAWIAGVAAFIFLLHPLQTQAVNYIWQRVTLLAAFFYLGTLVLYIHARLNKSRGYYRTALAACLLGMFSKEITFTLPLMIACIEYLFLNRACADKRSWLWVVPFLLLLLVIPMSLQRSPDLTLKIMHTENWMQGVSDQVIPRGEYALTQVNVLRTYLRLFFCPVNQSIDYDYPLASESGWFVWSLSFLILAAIASLGFFFRRAHPVISFCILWFFVTVSLESFVTSADFLVEHRLYLPMTGLSLGIVVVLYQWICRRNIRTAMVLGIAVCLLLGFMTYERNKVWNNDLTLWDDAIRKFPDKARSYNNRGVMFKKMNSFELALNDFNRALAIDPRYADALHNRGGIYKMAGDYERAAEDYARLVRLEPNNARGYDALASIYRRREMWDEALENLTVSIRIDPANAETYCNRAYIYQKQGKDDLAMADYSRAIRVDPSYVYAYNNRGNLYLKQGDVQRALGDYNRAIQAGPKFAEAYVNRAVANFDLGFLEESKADLETAQSLGAVGKPAFVERLNAALKSKDIQKRP